MIRLCIAATLLIALGSTGSPAAPGEKGASARPSAARAVRIVEKKYRHRFLYSYPASAAAIPALDRMLRKQAREMLADLREQARIGQTQNDVYYPMTFDQEWSVTAVTPQLLAMTSLAGGYYGGAHGIEAYKEILWGRSANRPLALGELFSQPRTAYARLSSEFCRRFRILRAARLRERGERADATRCPEAEFAAVVPVAGRDRKIRGFRMLLTGAQTQDARPIGTYEFDIPLSPVIRRLIRPQFAVSFPPQPQ